jgi:hypothetical protein
MARMTAYPEITRPAATHSVAHNVHSGKRTTQSIDPRGKLCGGRFQAVEKLSADGGEIPAAQRVEQRSHAARLRGTPARPVHGSR